MSVTEAYDIFAEATVAYASGCAARVVAAGSPGCSFEETLLRAQALVGQQQPDETENNVTGFPLYTSAIIYLQICLLLHLRIHLQMYLQIYLPIYLQRCRQIYLQIYLNMYV